MNMDLKLGLVFERNGYKKRFMIIPPGTVKTATMLVPINTFSAINSDAKKGRT